jgi:heme O synthase-like polyprenyltransferase
MTSTGSTVQIIAATVVLLTGIALLFLADGVSWWLAAAQTAVGLWILVTALRSRRQRGEREQAGTSGTRSR